MVLPVLTCGSSSSMSLPYPSLSEEVLSGSAGRAFAVFPRRLVRGVFELLDRPAASSVLVRRMLMTYGSGSFVPWRRSRILRFLKAAWRRDWAVGVCCLLFEDDDDE